MYVESNFLGEIGQFISEENDYRWAFKLFAFGGHLKEGYRKGFPQVLESCLREGCTMPTKDLTTRRWN